MAKKKQKYLIKLNNKIRNYFNGQAFDEGIAGVDDDKLIELIMLLQRNLSSHTHDDMVRALRRIWSEEGAGTRELIVSYLTQSYKSVHTSKSDKPKRVTDKVDKILILLEETPHTQQEENLILDAFINVSSSKITSDKVLNKLQYMRLSQRLKTLESALDAQCNTSNEMEFYHSFTFALKQYDFTKLLLCKTPSLSLNDMWESSDEEIIVQLKVIKAESIVKKSLEIERFLTPLSQENHPYLSQKHIYSSLKAMPRESSLSHAPIDLFIIEDLLNTISDKYTLFESSDHFIVEQSKHYTLFGQNVEYISAVSYEKPFIYHLIWSHSPLPVQSDMDRVTDELIAHFEGAVEEVFQDMQEQNRKLMIETSILEDFIVRFIVPQVEASAVLKVKEKSKRRILFHFQEYIKPLQAKQKREELLAKTIRDFKNLFPLARQLKRKIIFHVGPTNSGKTYTAMEALKSATTGYYLAPLRLLALEGYENLQKKWCFCLFDYRRRRDY
ncbi:MAG: hypothetical protein Q9M36_15590 [Sulfurovum sp.]|nr:hypothetical protein [Sulfurovum sp.]